MPLYSLMLLHRLLALNYLLVPLYAMLHTRFSIKTHYKLLLTYGQTALPASHCTVNFTFSFSCTITTCLLLAHSEAQLCSFSRIKQHFCILETFCGYLAIFGLKLFPEPSKGEGGLSVSQKGNMHIQSWCLLLLWQYNPSMPYTVPDTRGI
jgi:hypothetical protein